MWIKVVQLSSSDGPVVIKTAGFKTRLVIDRLIEMKDGAKVSALRPLIMEKFDTLTKKPSLIQVYELSEDDSRVLATKPSDILKAGVNYGFVDLSLPKQDQEQQVKVKDKVNDQEEAQDEEQQGRSWEKLRNAACNRWQLTVGNEWPGFEGRTRTFNVRYQQDGDEKGCMLHLALPGVGASMLTYCRATLEENMGKNPHVPAGTLVNFHDFGNDGVAMMSHAVFTDKPHKVMYAK